MLATCDGSFTWTDRAAQRGIALALASNLVLTALAWAANAAYYDSRVLVPAVTAMALGAVGFIVQTLRQRFRRHDLRVMIVILVAALIAMALSPTAERPPLGVSWTQGWAIAGVCGALLLLPRREGIVVVSVVTSLQWWLRLAFVPVGVAFVEATVPIVGALIVAWAARLATARFEQAAAALALAARAEGQAEEAAARADAQQWWNRVLHDKVLGALLLTSRATTPSLLAQARELAADALSTVSRMERAAADDQASASLAEPRPTVETDAAAAPEGLDAGLQRLVQRHDLVSDLRVRGHAGSLPANVREAILAAADQALRNVAQHSGQRSVWIRAAKSPTRVRLEIRDHGSGFDTSRVHERRLGLRTSIPGHMALVDGSAKVTSRPGRGTTVQLIWSPGNATERAAPVTAQEVQTWWWISGIYAGLHLLGGIFHGGDLVGGPVGWAGLSLIAVAYVLLHSVPDGRALAVGEALVLGGCALMLWVAPQSAAESWRLWFLAACYPALVIPALRGRPALSAGSGILLAVLIVAESSIAAPSSVRDALQMAVPFVVIPTVAGLYAVMMARANDRLQAAQATQARAGALLREAEAQRVMVSAQLSMLAPGTIDLFRRVVDGDSITARDRTAAGLMEAANRDQLVAGAVLDPEVSAVLAAARARGAKIHLTSGAFESLGDTDMPEAVTERLDEFRFALGRMAVSTVNGDELTARWQPTNSYAAGTLILASASDLDAEIYLTIPPVPEEVRALVVMASPSGMPR